MSLLAPFLLRPFGSAVISTPDDSRLHPKLRTFWGFWHNMRAARTTPQMDEMHPLVLKPWLGNVLLLDVLDGGRDFRYRVYGSIVAGNFGFDLTGRLVSGCT